MFSDQRTYRPRHVFRVGGIYFLGHEISRVNFMASDFRTLAVRLPIALGTWEALFASGDFSETNVFFLNFL